MTTKRNPKLALKEIFFRNIHQLIINLLIEDKNFTGYYAPIARTGYIPEKETPYTKQERIIHFREGMKTTGQILIDLITQDSNLLINSIEEETNPKLNYINSTVLEFEKEIKQALIAQRDPENPEWGLPDNKFTIEHVKNIGKNLLEKLDNFEKTL